MAQVAMTVLYEGKGRADLALPDNVPSQFLAEAMAAALGLRAQPGGLWELAVIDDGHSRGQERRISPASSLNDDGILCGSLLKLSPVNIAEGARAYLLSVTRVRFPLKDENIIGRKYEGGQVDIDLLPLSAEKVISREHAIIQRKGGEFELIDSNSRHGTWVNGQRVTGPVRLRNGDEVMFGPKGRGAVLVFAHS